MTRASASRCHGILTAQLVRSSLPSALRGTVPISSASRSDGVLRVATRSAFPAAGRALAGSGRPRHGERVDRRHWRDRIEPVLTTERAKDADKRVGGGSLPELEALQGPQADAGVLGKGRLFEISIQPQAAQTCAKLRASSG